MMARSEIRSRSDEYWMSQAIQEARYRFEKVGTRPFGAMVVDRTRSGHLIGEGYGSESPTDPTAHSELYAIQSACKQRDGLLEGCTLYTTLEPCMMCCGAINHAKVSRVVWGAFRGDCDWLRIREANARTLLGDTTAPAEYVGGVLREECVQLLELER